MIKKDILMIIISADTGSLFFTGNDSILRDTGGVRVVYEQKNDAEIVNSFYSVVDRKMHELFYDGIIAKMGIPLGEIDRNSKEYKKLENTHALVDVLKTGTKNKINIRLDGKKSYIISNENGSNFIYGDCIEHPESLIGRFISFVDAMNTSKNKYKHSQAISKIASHVEKSSKNNTPNQ